ncbi:hypothetical protein Cflav_PD1716 [Pedosphaera parvula Ellin514]|uniref:Uncharacterized protein n=1 Tax=Pedosphaera parvula (strain Ellin514) TaxID=320771 RepID=B9XMV8_PEDPL|nr:hypothetical protein Cflav_PD1716 [Pedosphaera parvula Ellin514]
MVFLAELFRLDLSSGWLRFAADQLCSTVDFMFVSSAISRQTRHLRFGEQPEH